MTTIIWPSNTKQIIDEIRGTIGREITIFYALSGITCSACDIDTITGRSLDPFCPDCAGAGVVDVEEDVTVLAHVLWTNVGDSYKSPAGEIDTGNCKVTIEYLPELVPVVEQAKSFLVDDKKLFLVDYDLRGVKDINRIAINLKQDPRDGKL